MGYVYLALVSGLSKVEETKDAVPELISLRNGIQDALHMIQTNSQWEPMRPVADILLNACKMANTVHDVRPFSPIDACAKPIDPCPQLYQVPPRDRGQLPLAYQWSSDSASNGRLISFGSPANSASTGAHTPYIPLDKII